MSAPDTTDLRSGTPVHDALLALLPLVGVWQGTGHGVSPTGGDEFAYGQQITVAHDGRPFLAYESRSWLVDADGAVLRQAWRESGFWRPGAGQDDVELVLASNTGQALVFAGTAGDQSWEIATESVRHTPTAVDVAGERRLYAIRAESLIYATELALGGSGDGDGGGNGDQYAAHLNARLTRA